MHRSYTSRHRGSTHRGYTSKSAIWLKRRQVTQVQVEVHRIRRRRTVPNLHNRHWDSKLQRRHFLLLIGVQNMEKMYVKDVSLHNSTWNLTRTQRINQKLLWVKTFGALDVIIVDDIDPKAPHTEDVIRMLMLKLLDTKGTGIPFGGS